MAKKKVVLIGHCGPDSSFLKSAIRTADREAEVLAAEDEATLRGVLKQGVDLLLFNRELGYGFAEELGVDVIRRLKKEFPGTKMMLVSNYEDAQAAAVSAGALPGFGKRELGSPRAGQVLGEALK